MLPRVPGQPPRDLSKPLEEVRARVHPELGGLRLDQALRRLMPWRSRSSLQRLIREGLVRLLPGPGTDGSRAADPARASLRVQSEDILVVRVPPRLAPDPPARHGEDDLRVVFEDRWLVALDKPAPLAVHPSGSRLSGTLINLLHGRYRAPEDPARDVVPRLCHRLDRETSGLILVAKEERVHAEVRKQFEALTVAKSYLAVVEGEPGNDEGWIDRAIGPARRSPIRLKMEVRGDGLHAVTHYRVVERANGLALLQCIPKTGRQHQIRVHLAAIGHPVVGDKLYGPDERCFLDAAEGALGEDALARLRLPRHALHSHGLSFKHPVTHERLELCVPLPADIEALLSERAASEGPGAASRARAREAREAREADMGPLAPGPRLSDLHARSQRSNASNS